MDKVPILVLMIAIVTDLIKCLLISRVTGQIGIYTHLLMDRVSLKGWEWSPLTLLVKGCGFYWLSELQRTHSYKEVGEVKNGEFDKYI